MGPDIEISRARRDQLRCRRESTMSRVRIDDLADEE
jgi:hypothetical protein